MPNKEPKNEIMRVVGNVILYSAGVCIMFALIAGVTLWFDSIRDARKQNSESIKEDVSVLKGDVDSIKGKLNLPT